MLRTITFLLIGFLIPASTYATGYLSSAVRTTRYKTAVDTSVPLSSAVRHPGGSSYAADPWADYWVFDGSDYLTASDSSKLKSSGTDFALMLGVMRDNTANKTGWLGKGGGSTKEYEMYSLANDNVYGAYYANGTTFKYVYAEDGSPHGTKSCVGVTYTFDGTYIDLEIWAKPDGGVVKTRTTANQTAPLYLGTNTFYVGSNSVENAEGRLYFIAIFQTAAIDQTDVENVMAGTTHPVDLAPSFYIDFSKAVGGTYKSEVGNITLTVHGTPVKGP